MMREAIAFDLDGTLVDISHRDYDIYCDIIHERGGQSIKFSNYWEMRRARTDIHLILSQSGISNQKNIEYFLLERKRRMEDWAYLRNDKLIFGVADTLIEYSKRYDIYILTIRHNKENTEKQLSLLGMDRYNRIIVPGNKEKELANIPNVIAMVGDTENDVLSANNIGIKSVAVLSGIRNENLLKEMAPSYIISTITELRTIL